MSILGQRVVFAAQEAIESGAADAYLDTLIVACRARQRLLERRKEHRAARPPQPERTPEMIEKGQVWVGMTNADRSWWEVRGTGVVLAADSAAAADARRRAAAALADNRLHEPAGLSNAELIMLLDGIAIADIEAEEEGSGA